MKADREARDTRGDGVGGPELGLVQKQSGVYAFEQWSFLVRGTRYESATVTVTVTSGIVQARGSVGSSVEKGDELELERETRGVFHEDLCSGDEGLGQQTSTSTLGP